MLTKRTSKNEHLIFVSYAHENQGWIEDLELKEDPCALVPAEFWIDQNRIHPSDVWNEEATQALQRATAVVLLISRQFLDSPAIREYELPIIKDRYRKGEISVAFVPIGKLDTTEVADALGIEHIHNLVSIPAWREPLPVVPEPRTDIRDKIVSAVTEPLEVQNLRRNMHPKYHLIESLGYGPLGTVFTAHDSQLDRQVAIKLLRSQKHDRHFKDSVRKIVRATEHTNILSVYGAYLNAVPSHYVRQYAPGDSLRTLLDNNYYDKSVPIFLVQELLQAVGAAIHHAHRKDIYGINIKPSNVIVMGLFSSATREYFLSLSSYREEHLLQDEKWRTTGKDVMFVPLEYRSKDVVRDAQDPQKADQYRLGLVAYEMLIGAARLEELGKPLRQLDFEPTTWQWPTVAKERQDCPEYICHAVDRMIKTDPEERYVSLEQALTNFRTDLDVEVVRESYRRLMAAEEGQTDFFRSFYMRFLDHYPKAESFFKPKEKFGPLTAEGQVSEGWQRQFQVLKEAVLLLVVFDAFQEDQHEPNVLTRIVEEHAKRGIPAGLYQGFGKVLIDTAVAKDEGAPVTPGQLKDAWTNVIQPGIDYMRRRTEEIELDRYK